MARRVLALSQMQKDALRWIEKAPERWVHTSYRTKLGITRNKRIAYKTAKSLARRGLCALIDGKMHITDAGLAYVNGGELSRSEYRDQLAALPKLSDIMQKILIQITNTPVTTNALHPRTAYALKERGLVWLPHPKGAYMLTKLGRELVQIIWKREAERQNLQLAELGLRAPKQVTWQEGQEEEKKRLRSLEKAFLPS